MKSARAVAFAIFLSAVLPTSGFAQIYLEVDPLAYVMKGYSLHAGNYFSLTKADIGVFGLEIPQSVHGNKDFTVTMTGFGAKFHYTGGTEGGWFAGLGGGYTKKTYSVSGGSTSKNSFSLGIEVGYRYQFKDTGLYLQPWLGIDHAFSDKKLIVNGKIFEESEISFFPTVHIGWKF